MRSINKVLKPHFCTLDRERLRAVLVVPASEAAHPILDTIPSLRDDFAESALTNSATALARLGEELGWSDFQRLLAGGALLAAHKAAFGDARPFDIERIDNPFTRGAWETAELLAICGSAVAERTACRRL